MRLSAARLLLRGRCEQLTAWTAALCDADVDALADEFESEAEAIARRRRRGRYLEVVK
ncbi:MAG: hypothetical protein KatS3mg010_1534 [Acidimicrobiia bacterium]|nr:MAG: hypothetical protein KatS3mg010_1534 [Acidimicrobiia bacterium]